MAEKQKTKTKHRFLKRFLKFILGIVLLFCLLILFIRSPWGQNIIVQKATNYISSKTNTVVNIENAFITFDGNVALDGLYLEDTKGDTLLYSKSLEANLPIWGIIKGTSIGIDNVKWNGVKANIVRKDTINGYNFQFLIDAFTSQNESTIVKDTIATSPNLEIGSLDLSNFDVVYNDIPLGIKSSYKFGSLEAVVKNIDIENFTFETNSISLSNADIKYKQLPVKVSSSVKETPILNLFSENITIQNTKLFYEDEVNSLLTDATIDTFTSEKLRLNLESNVFDIQSILLQKSNILVKTKTKKTSNTVETSSTFLWPNIALNIGSIDLTNTAVDYIVNDQKIRNNLFDANALSFNNINLKANAIAYKNKNAALDLERFSFKESSGVILENLSFNTTVTNQKILVNNLLFKLDNNTISGDVALFYNSLSSFLETPENVRIETKLPKISLDLKRFFTIVPSLKSNQYINEISKKMINANINATGSLANLNINNSKINWGSSTKINLEGSIENLTKPKKIQIKIPKLTISTTKKDVQPFIAEQDLGIALPETMSLTGYISGGLDAIATDLEFNSSQGKIAVNGNFNNNDNIDFQADINIKDYELDKLLNNKDFKDLSLTIKANGSGQSLDDLDATFKANVSKFNFNNYVINNLVLEGKVKEGEGSFTSKYKDNNLNTELNASVNLDTINTKASLSLHVIGADLKGLGVMKRNVKTGFELSAEFNGNLKKYTANAEVNKGVVVYDNNTYLLGKVTAHAFSNKDSTDVNINNKMLNLKLASNTDPQSLASSLQKHISSYFYRDVTLNDSLQKNVAVNLNGKISQTPLLSEVFLVNLKDIDTIAFSLDFNEKNKNLDAKITAPHINYSGNEIDSLAFTMHTDKKNFNFKFGFNEIDANPFKIPKTVITGNQTNNELSLNFSGIYNSKTLMNVNAKITGSRDRLVFSVNPKNLILNKEKWNIPIDNEVVLLDNSKFTFQNFKINKNNQSIAITDQLKNIEKNHIGLLFNNFKISEVFNYLNPEIELAKGDLNGDFILEDPLNDTGILANVTVNQLELLKTDLGKLTIDAKSLGNNTYDFNAKLKEGTIDLNLTGEYFVENKDANLNLDLALNSFKMKALNTLSLGEIKETSGSFSGNFKVTGTTKKPLYTGKLNFNNATFNIIKLNTKFTLPNENLELDNNGLYFSKFTVLDEKKNALTLSGKIGTENFLNPQFDLKLKAKNFRVLNATKEDNPTLYGLATFNANADLTGDLQIPKLSANVTLGSESNITYVLPSTYASVENRDEVVVFVNKENPDAILTQTKEKSAIITGFDIFTKLKVNKDASVKVVINEDTEDNFKVSGDGEFVINMKPNGNLSLTGNYEIVDGHYELNLYGLVKRKFYLAKGSTIKWSGDPFEANLDVSAIYNIETSASPLMAAQISNEDPSVKNSFKQVLPFDVYLNIDGELLQPKISFNLEMPEDEQGAIGGQVYGRVQQVNQQEEELNKQVFSLLVLNRFYPNSGSDGSSGGFATIARDNLNDAVSGQLNAFSDKILGKSGIELDFDLNSYTDYQGSAATDRTQLGVTAQKKLFNERLTVRVGSDLDIEGSNQNNQETPLIGNVSIEYKVSKDGRYRLRGFRKSEFENVIDGQTIVSGIALIFTQEFNEFRELWDAIFRAQNEKKITEEKVEEEDEKEKTETNTKNKN